MIFPLYLMGSFCLLLVFSFENFKQDLIFVEKGALFTEIDQLPNNVDILKYIDALRRIVDFSSDHKNDVDINLYFGLFLANVSLKRVYGDKYETMPGEIRDNLLEIIVKLEHLSKIFSQMVTEDTHSQNSDYRAIFTLFESTSSWISKLLEFHEDFLITDQENIIIKSDLPYLNLDLYTDVNVWVPNPQESNFCIARLSTARKIHNGTLLKCKVSDLCIDILKEGTDFGYALAHRLLFLLFARMGQGCYVFSEYEDKQLSQEFCAIAFEEAKYIVKHDYILVDLLLEHVALCSLDGHAQFLRRSWLSKILRFQTAFGCFSHDITKVFQSFLLPRVTSQRLWTFANTNNNDILDGICNGHTTALAASTLASAIRFIINRDS